MSFKKKERSKKYVKCAGCNHNQLEYKPYVDPIICEQCGAVIKPKEEKQW